MWTISDLMPGWFVSAPDCPDQPHPERVCSCRTFVTEQAAAEYAAAMSEAGE